MVCICVYKCVSIIMCYKLYYIFYKLYNIFFPVTSEISIIQAQFIKWFIYLIEIHGLYAIIDFQYCMTHTVSMWL